MNDKNLVRPEDLTPSERRESARKAGKASAESRRRKKALKALMNDLLSSDIVNDEIYNSAVDMGCNNPTYGAAVVAAMVREAANGNTKAFNAIVDLIGEGSSGERVKLQKKQVALQEKKQESTGTDGKLTELIEGLKNDIHE